MKNLQKRIDTIFDYLYASSTVKNTEIMAYEFSKILHTGIFIEKTYKQIPAFKNYFIVESDSIFTNYSDISYIRNNFLEMNKSWGLYKNEKSIILSDKDILFICAQFSDMSLSDKSIDLIGDSLEIFRNYSIKSLGGQFFTDAKVTNLALDLINFSPLIGETFIDICSGTGGFLLAAINKIKKDLDNNSIEDEGVLANIVYNQVFGKEIDETVRHAANRNIQTRIGVKKEYVKFADSLILPKKENDLYDCIATNPPFGTKTTITSEDILNNYELSHKNGSKNVTPTPPDILFLEQNINLLKPETGRCAIVLPYQILSGPKAIYIRDWLLKKCQIIAVIDLPVETFQPHTGTKTSLLIVKKYKCPLDDLDTLNYNIFISKPQWIGHDRRGLPVYMRNPDGSESSKILCDFDIVLNDWILFNNNKLKKSKISCSINVKQIIADESHRINALFYLESSEIKESITGVELKKLVSNIFYPGRFKRNYVSSEANSVPFLGGANITEQIVSTKKYISKTDPHYEQLVVREGWILITRSGTTGIVSIVPKDWDGFAISEHVIRIIPDERKENSNYLYAFLQSEQAKKQLSKQVFGSVIDEISPEAVGNLIVPQIPQKQKEIIIRNIENFRKLSNESLAFYRNAQHLFKSFG
ncbi:MAG: N-6 DNA methylase [Spirochaetia bacterium]|nr:N-6 DNA methylase [Spirochaetia bacterium]